MCFVDSAPLLASASVSRRGFLAAGALASAAMAAANVGRSLLLPGVAEGAETPSRSGGPRGGGGDLQGVGAQRRGNKLAQKTNPRRPRVQRLQAGVPPKSPKTERP